MANTPLRSRAVGTTVQLNLNSKPTAFLVVQQGNPSPTLYDASCDGTWLMAQQVLSTRSWGGGTANDLNDYGASPVHQYLQQDFYNLLDADAKALVKTVRIPWCQTPDDCLDGVVASGAGGLETKAFLPGLLELGIDEGIYAPQDGVRLAYFEEGTGTAACAKRKALLNGTAAVYWTRSLHSLGDTDVHTIQADGTSQSTSCGWAGGGVRPVLILSGAAMVQEDGTVVPNAAPTQPGAVTLPETLTGGSPTLVQWGASTDPEGALTGYELERSINGGASFEAVYSGAAAQYTDTLPSGCTQVQYRVRAVDGHGGASAYTLSAQRSVSSNSAPVIASQTPAGTDLGEQTEPFSVQYTVTDPDDDTVTVQEHLDETLLRSFTAVLGAANTLEIGAGQLALLTAGSSHTLRVTASDGEADAAPYTVLFQKGEAPPEPVPASIRLAAPLAAAGRIRALRLTVEGEIPADAVFSVQAANNALDTAPAWEEMTDAVRSGQIHRFANQTAAAGWALDFKISAARGGSGTGGWISAVAGSYLAGAAT